MSDLPIYPLARAVRAAYRAGEDDETENQHNQYVPQSVENLIEYCQRLQGHHAQIIIARVPGSASPVKSVKRCASSVNVAENYRFNKI